MSLLDQVTSQLASIELQDEDIAEYITGIVQEESMADEEKKEVISDFLSEATDKSTDTVIDKLLTEWKLMQESKQKNESDKRKKLIEEARAREEERSLKYQEELSSIKQTEQRQLTKEEKEARDKLVRQYGYVADGEEEEEKETDKDRRKGRQPNEDPLLATNRNAEVIKEQERIRREQMKMASDKEKERNKMLQEKQKKEKTLDKEKKKTQKGERRRM